ncbi:AT-hook motif nuclear-localized protein 9-like [Iris pallida]|uniref:AT-hook motif nuclear-localized protein n=1 Tax=Iris pallida TaxID=29817 RepID=A0AAX6HKA1_IRIPA|nr:AT-hook motif nuclear-localized protein 9-like [Iris pallida]KAJ6841077.1 AT-hook motif nuclear-localized protein 9-like [Iris pallida]
MDGRDGREAMAMPGGSPYYMNRGLGSPGGGHQPGLSGMRQMPNPNPIGGGAGSFQLDSSMSMPMSMSIPTHGMNVGGGGSFVGEPAKRKRGRPRKYGPDGSVALALSPLPSSVTPTSGSGSGSGGGAGLSVSVSGSPGLKRGRGRPPGTGRKQQLASLGEWVSGSAGMGFTPHIITIDAGEDIATKIMSFSQQGPRAVCILSATGAVSTVTLRQSATSGGTATYEGRFEILCLSGSYLLTDDGGSRSRSGGLSISLSNPDGRVIGGGVGGSLIAATPVQVIVGSFLYGGTKAKNKAKTDQDSGPEHELQMGDMGDTQCMPTSAMSNQTLTASVLSGWPGTRQMDTRNAHMDIDLTRG